MDEEEIAAFLKKKPMLDFCKALTIQQGCKVKSKELQKYEVTDNKGNVLLDEFNINKPQRTLKPRRLNTSELLLIPERNDKHEDKED